ncbi:MAG: adenosylcobalamin-dependent ribonucleoside-diphosphate reductase, partial [Candidatus Paceibacterota bacterium]
LFFDRINEFNPLLKSLGPLTTTNPCSELTLYPNESCNLGSINVSAFVKKNHNNGKKPQFDWEAFEEVIKKATRFLDNVIDISKHPLPEIEEMTLNTRKIGLGIMGLGDLLYELGISYNDKEGLEFMEQLMEFVAYYSKVVSIESSKERGRAPYFEKSFYKEGKLPFSASKDKKSWHFDWADLAKKMQKYGIRNIYTTTIAPTGSLSMLAGTSSGIEPVYSLVFEKSIAIGNFFYIDPVFNEAMQTEGLMDEALIKEVAEAGGTIHNVPYIPQKMKKIFVVAHDIAPEQHVKVLASFQRWVDASISKTNNFPSDATVEDVRKAYFLAYELGCKGVTVYRDKSLQTQVLIGGSRKGAGEKPKDGVKLTVVKDEKAKGLAVYHEAGAANAFTAPAEDNPEKTGEVKMCPNCNIELVFQEGCRKCPACSWGLCS